MKKFRNFNSVKLFGLLIIGVTSVGCSSNHLVYVQEASMGLNIALGTEGSQKFSLGYDRDVFAIVPKKGKNSDVMSLFSINNARISGLDDLDISEFIATGEPAKKLAREPNSVDLLRKKIYGK